MVNRFITRFRETPNNKLIYRGVVTFILLVILIIELARFLSLPKVDATTLYLREQPNDESKVVETIPHGRHLSIIKSKNNWWYTKYNGQKGWVPSWLVSVDNYNVKNGDKLAQKTIIIDPGHGGGDSGTLSANQKYMEKTYTLQTAKKVAAELRKKHVNVVMTRTDDTYVTLKKRTDMASDYHADLFVSFHFNSDNGYGRANGYGIYNYHKNAVKVADQVADGLDNLPVSNRGVSFGDYYVLRENKRPAILCEMGFMDSSHDLPYIQSSTYQEHVAKDVAKSLDKYFN
ncbi:hypothetical protein AKUH3B204M_14430 [Apilactobacillus kunkeei]|uniref:N-acetylmuramoyl-L-alanine amidase n=1 Tax=Apilactobacillus kunkeei TaxID=148814 RepID=UPI0021FBF57C|nr:N-acetylmuramoyl-L-alanine amidase [Apilactobacillus kunkeei]UZX33189.1 N-acetylmuramoyl-L-alanine amidase [Apilactobacillus kunkeei]CAI2671248.1 hypothetical protein AKUH3B204M_14430 [Apilactobacillus kunkeei]CAI2671431.1 hypothetical protein AKUA0901_15080 [Apilactobacillus kunkeei]CAI2672877.1 hypothetical protein AKUA1802_15090 [Apilactobacillus kunkeei]CAI2674076.1 hypothetical protein AKUA1201_15070 [Apilactobacillus kunkeei]